MRRHGEKLRLRFDRMQSDANRITPPRPYTRGNPGASSEVLFFNEGDRDDSLAT